MASSCRSAKQLSNFLNIRYTEIHTHTHTRGICAQSDEGPPAAVNVSTSKVVKYQLSAGKVTCSKPTGNGRKAS